jgi:7-carboxy-7-deazaguanine synthase
MFTNKITISIFSFSAKDNSMKLKVNEIFHSIQGESVHSGLPCTFIRLTGCNLRCRYCDTRYAFTEGNRRTVSQILEQVAGFGCNLVEITGGEPLFQENTPELARSLLATGYQVLVETNGSLDIDRIGPGCSRIMDIKCPSSGEAERNDLNNLDRLTENDQVKFVIGDRNDFDFACDMVPGLPERLPFERILFSAIDGQLEPSLLARWILEERLKVRLQVQIHKVLWPDQDRGI